MHSPQMLGEMVLPHKSKPSPFASRKYTEEAPVSSVNSLMAFESGSLLYDRVHVLNGHIKGGLGAEFSNVN